MQVVLDFETRSQADLKKVGAAKYAADPTTDILCLGYKIDDEATRVWVPGEDRFPRELIELSRDRAYIWIAHNAFFEFVITHHVLKRKVKAFQEIPFERIKCTAAKAAAYALPRSLEGACEAINLAVKKNMDGRKIMLRYSKPRNAWREWFRERWYKEPEKYFSDREGLQKVYDYCMTDVDAEYLLDKTIPDLTPFEQRVWILNQKMNFRGVKVDTDTASKILNLILDQEGLLTEELEGITGGAVTSAGQRDRILKFLKTKKVPLKSLTAKSVEETLSSESVRGPARRVLEIRQALSKSSTKKYVAILERASGDGRVKDLAMYHGAHTGREAGRGLQIQNLPKGNIKNTDAAIDVIRTGDPELLEMLYGPPMEAYSACIRGMITASPGFKLFAADFNAIECRVLNWLAGEKEVLADFESGVDLYVKMAKRVGSKDRQLGKTIELACGYGMGKQKLFETCIAWGVNGGLGISEEMSEAGIRAYRNSHKNVVSLWAKMERVAIKAVKSQGQVFKLGALAWCYDGRTLWCQLPSGRRNHYHAPEIRLEPTPWGEYAPKLYHWKVNPKTKKWECASTYGGLLVENTVQGIARDIMVTASLKIEKLGYRYLFSVHDEIVAESKAGAVEEFENILLDSPKWAHGLPVAAKGWTGFRYKKG